MFLTAQVRLLQLGGCWCVVDFLMEVAGAWGVNLSVNVNLVGTVSFDFQYC